MQNFTSPINQINRTYLLQRPLLLKITIGQLPKTNIDVGFDVKVNGKLHWHKLIFNRTKLTCLDSAHAYFNIYISIIQDEIDLHNALYQLVCTTQQNTYLLICLIELYPGYCSFYYLSSLILIIFTLIFFIFMFHFLSTTSENFLQPALKTLAQSLNMSQTLAGLTFLALGNGAPDMITAIAATLSQQKDNLSLYPIGSIFGACLISTTLVLANAIEVSPIQIDARQTPREMIFYLMAGITLLIFGGVGVLYWWMPLILFGYYIIYCVLVIKLQYDKKRNISLIIKENIQTQIQTQISQQVKQIQVQNTFIHHYQFLLNVLRKLTIPCPQSSQWNKKSSILSIFIFPTFTYSAIRNFQINWIQIAVTITIGLILSVVVYLTSGNQPPIYQPVLSLLAFLSSIIWLSIAGSILMNYLQFIQLITDSNPIYLGLTILAMGNTAGDYFSISAMAKAGLGKMAVAGVYGGQLFNFLVGFSVAGLVGTLSRGGELSFKLFEKGQNGYENISNGIGYIVIFSFLFNAQTGVILFKRFFLRATFKRYLLWFYAILMLGLSCLAIGSDMVYTPTCQL